MLFELLEQEFLISACHITAHQNVPWEKIYHGSMVDRSVLVSKQENLVKMTAAHSQI